MSWDFQLVVDVGGEYPEVLREYDNINYTYNVSPMFYDIDTFGKEGIRILDGMRCRDARPLISKSWQAMMENPKKYKAMNPENGWGNYDGALKLLEKLTLWCINAPEATIRVS